MLVRLEMDEERMSFLSFDSLPAWAMFLSSAAHLTAGIVLGSPLFPQPLVERPPVHWRRARTTTTIALMIGRFALLGGLLTLASLEGALPLLMMALGVLIARSVVMRRVREAAP